MDSSQKLGYVSLGDGSPDEYYTPFRVSIFYEDVDFYTLIAASADKSQAVCLPDAPLATLGNLANKFKYFSPDALVLSSRFTEKEYNDLRERGFQRIIMCDYSHDTRESTELKLKTEAMKVIYTTPTNVLDYVKLIGNAYFLAYDYISIITKDCENLAQVSLRLRCIKCGLTFDGSSYFDALSIVCNKLTFTIDLESIITRGQTYFDISELEANKHIAQAKILSTTLDSESAIDIIDIALIQTSDVARDALMHIAPLIERIARCNVFVYFEYDLSRMEFVLKSYSNGKSAYLTLCALNCTNVSGDVNSAVGYIKSLDSILANEKQKESI